MKILSKCLLYLLTAITLSFPIVHPNLTIFAAETDEFSSDTTDSTFESTNTLPVGTPFQPTDSYVLAYGQGGVSDFAYFSPFVPELTYNGDSILGYSILFGLKNITTGDISEVAYCTDMPVDAVTSNYQRLNLTDSTYAASHADKLRSIVLNSYPHITLDSLRNTSGISELSMYEAITATQLAIWKAAHGEIIQIKNFLSLTDSNWKNSGNPSSAEAEYTAYQHGSSEYKNSVKSRIEALYHYLISLDGQPATAPVISSSSFTGRSTSPTLTSNNDGTYNVSVSASVSIPSGSNVTLTAHIGDGYWYTQIPLSAGSNTYNLTIQNVPASYASGPVTLSIDGTQTVNEDVFLLDAKGIRGVSQSMIAPLSGSMPVHAEIQAKPNHILEIYKTSSDDSSPLSNISFEIYYIGSMEDYLNGTLGIGSKPTSSDIYSYAVSERLVGTITTDSNGYGSLNFGTDQGVYLIKELPNELVTDTSVFFVTLPDYSRCDENGDPAYTITAHPKNTLRKEKIEIEKDVTNLDNEHDTFPVGEDHTWIIQSSIPYSIASGKKYEISDTLDRRLTLKSVDKVAIAQDSGTFGNSEDSSYVADENETPAGTEEENALLVKDRDYTIFISKTESGEDMFSVSLTSAGIQKLSSYTAEDRDCYELRIYFTAQINTSASMGENIPNQAHISYTNSLGKIYTADSDQPEVHTGGIQLLKTDSQNNLPLKNAVFSLYREATSEELGSGIKYEEIKVGDTVRKMIPVSFYSAPAMDEEKVFSFSTDENGLGYFYGLAYGDYYLIETQAPQGYNKLSEPQKFTISADSHKKEFRICVTNMAGAELPSTGGIGTYPFIISGLLLISITAILLFRSRYVNEITQ